MTTDTAIDLAEVKMPPPRAWPNPSGADAVFRAALARGDFPIVPAPLTAAAGAMGRLRDLEAAQRDSETLTDVIRQTVDDLLTARPVDPQEFDAALLQASARASLDAARIQISSSMHREMEAGWFRAISDALPELLGGLRVQLEELLPRVRVACEALGGLDFDDPAAVAGASGPQRKALLELRPMAVQYQRVRIAQMAALSAVSDRNPAAPHRTETWDPTWADVFSRGVHEFSEVGLYGAVPEQPSGLSRLYHVAARTDVWLPDREQLDEAWAALSLGRAELRARRAEQAERDGLVAA